MTYAEVLMRKGKRGAAAYVQAECNSAAQEPSRSPQHLNALLDVLLHPEKSIDDQDTIEWCRSLIGGGKSYEDFAANLRSYDNTAMCGLVWTADFVAFRCRTCGISQCMSLCADCFKDGNHEGHDFNMFKSQAGGACDCGDSSVMRESGFCSQHHGANIANRATTVPSELTCVAENMIPRIILRFLQHLRINVVPATEKLSAEATLEKYEEVISNADRFLKLLHDFCSLGAGMRSVMTRCLVDKASYQRLTFVDEETEVESFMRRSKRLYEEALESLPNPHQLKDFNGALSQLQHTTFMEELVFWTVKYEFPEKLVCLLLKMLPDAEYKEAFTRSFVMHYSRVSVMLVRSSNSDKLSNRIVHVSVQLFSNEELALQMTEQLSLLHIMVSSLKNMMHDVLVTCELHEPAVKKHKVVDCSKHVMSDHCYWPLVSDLNNVLSHPPIAFRFMADNSLLTMWFDFLKMFQGMNLNVRVKGQHVDFEEKTYYASFSGELEASASPMWALVSHLKDENTRECTLNVLKHCLAAIKEWMEDVQFDSPENFDFQVHPDKASFHLPLHRYFSVFLRQAIKYQGFTLKELLPDQETLKLLAMHPLRVQTAFYEIMCGLWVRNGLQIKGQAMTYIQCHFCKSMVDADLFLLQVLATQLPPKEFLQMIMEKFQILDWLSLSPVPKTKSRSYRDQEQELQMIESTLTFLASILALRTNLGLDEESLSRLEMVSLLCMADKTHSSLHEHMPEKPGTPVQLELFDRVLSDIASYSEPRFEAGGNMQQGMYLPKPFVWELLYDPIYVQLRAVHRRDFQTSIERFNFYAKARFDHEAERLKTVMSPWPPWRLPTQCDAGFEDPRRILHSKYAHGLIFNILYKAVHGPLVNDFITSLAVYLLELAITLPQTEFSGKEVAVSKPWLMIHEPVDLKFDSWFPTDWLSANLRHTVTAIFSHPSATVAHPGQVEAGPRRTGGRHRLPTQTETALAAVHQSMEIDHLSDDDLNEDAYQLISTSGLEVDVAEQFALEMAAQSQQQAPQGESSALAFNQRLALTGPTFGDTTALVLARPEFSSASAAESPTSPQPLPSTATLALLSGSEIVAATRRNRSRAAIRDETTDLCPDAISALPSDYNSMRKNAVININESIISLMLRLHTKYSGRRDSYIPIFQRDGFSTEYTYRRSRIGDACFFIEKVLDMICEFDSQCAQFVQDSRKKLWPDYHELEAKRDEERAKQEAEEKKKKAKERQKQLMEQMALQRQRFMEGNAAMQAETLADGESDDPVTSASVGDTASESTSSVVAARPQTEYTCCHCLLQAPASEERPIGLVTLAQSTSVLGHKQEYDHPLILPTSEIEASEANHRSGIGMLSERYENFFNELSRNYNLKSVFMSTNRGWNGGLHVQSCGHHMHYDCRMSYCETLKSLMRVTREQSLDTDRGEFICPVCRQMANSLLPIQPDRGEPLITLPPSSDRAAEARVVAWFLSTEPDNIFRPPVQTILSREMTQMMEFLSKATLPQYRIGKSEYPTHYILMFIGSIARINLELDLVQRGGTLVVETRGAAALPPFSSQAANTNKLKFCFVPLLQLLSINMRLKTPKKQIVEDWGDLTGLGLEGAAPLARDESYQPIVPSLSCDPLAKLIQFVLLLPITVDTAYFNLLVQSCFNLQLCQIFVKICANMAPDERLKLKKFTSNKVVYYLDKISSALEGTCLVPESSAEHVAMECDTAGDSELIRYEDDCRKGVLPFLRVAALLKHYIYQQDLPDINDESLEFERLLMYLELVAPYDASSMDQSSSGPYVESVVSGLRWFTPNGSELTRWCQELVGNLSLPASTAIKVGVGLSVHWKQPRLLKLPRNYDQIFQFYHKRPCERCKRIPKDPTVCLMCGTMVCLKETCCKQPALTTFGVCEAVKHSWDCGGGTGIFLSVNSSTIVVIRGKRACFWGSIYLDVFGEEDRELKRGKPLYLHPERYQLLEHQWLSHKFDHTNRKWVWHRDAI